MMRFVQLKAEEQLDMQILHRVRDRLVGERTALLTSCARYCWSAELLSRKAGASSNSILTHARHTRTVPRMRSLLQDMRAEWQALDRQIETFDE